MGSDFQCIDEPNIINEKKIITVIQQYKLVTQLSKSFWDKWSKDYFAQLQIHNKRRKGFPSIKIYDLVIFERG